MSLNLACFLAAILAPLFAFLGVALWQVYRDITR